MVPCPNGSNTLRGNRVEPNLAWSAETIRFTGFPLIEVSGINNP
jgi:hypothetical protein